MEITTALKEHWPIALGATVGLYVVYKYMSGNSASSASGVTSGALAYQGQQNQLQAQTALAMGQLQNQSDAQTAAQNLAMATLQAQSTAANIAGETAYNTSIGNTASSVAGGIAQVIQAQSILPATAINAAMNNNQTALTGAAAVAVSGINNEAAITSVPAGIINKQLDQQTQANKDFYTSLTNSGNQVVAANMSAMASSSQSFGSYAAQANPLVVNAVGTSAGNQTAAVSSTAATAAAAGGASNQSMWGTVGTIGAYALMYG